MSHPLVTFDNVAVRLAGNDILRGVCATLPRGKITALMGLNGSGKTTLLRALLREIPFRGSIAFHCGHDHRQPTPEHIGYVPQRLRLEANLPLTVRELFALTMQRWPIFLGIASKHDQDIRDTLATVGTRQDLLDRPVTGLSGGELQRVLLALALRPSPELLVLDEPAAGIDFHDQERFYDLIGQLNQQRRVTVLMVSHDIPMIERHAHHLWCLQGGVIQRAGTPQELFSKDTLQAIFAK